MGGMVGIALMPCPECGTPMIFHAWPLVGLVLIARSMKNRLRGTGSVGPAARPADTLALISAEHSEERCGIEIMRTPAASEGHEDGLAMPRRSKETSNGQR